MEHYNVVLTDEAKADIRAAARYIVFKLREPNTAESLLDSFDEEITSLETMPERYGYVHDEYLASLGIRMAAVGKYLLFYLTDRAALTVTVIRVLHGRRDWIALLTDQFPATPTSTPILHHFPPR